MATTARPQAAELSRIGLGRLVFALLRQRFTGMVTLPQDAQCPTRRTIWIRKGMPIFTDWESPRDRLGVILVEDGLLTAARCGRALHERSPTERLGQVLLRQGLIDAPTLGQALQTQCARKLAQCFALRKGRARIIAHDDLSEISGDLTAPVNVLALVLAGVSAHYDEVRVFTEMGAAVQGPLRASAAVTRYRANFSFREDDEVILGALQRGTDLPSLLRLPASPTRVAQIVYTLWACQMLRVGSEALRAYGAPTGSQVRAVGGEIDAARLTPSALAATFMSELGELEARIAVGASAADLLGVAPVAPADEIRAAWRRMSVKFHPDALARQGFSHLGERAIDVFSRLSEAHRALLSCALRGPSTSESGVVQARKRRRATVRS
jgi:hypothetical protein